MRLRFSLSALVLACASLTSLAGEPVNLDLYLNGGLRTHVTLQGANSSYTYWLGDAAGTMLQLRLVAPEPLIVDVEETTEGRDKPLARGRIKLVGAGSSVALAEMKDSEFQHAFVLVRPQ